MLRSLVVRGSRIWVRVAWRFLDVAKTLAGAVFGELTTLDSAGSFSVASAVLRRPRHKGG